MVLSEMQTEIICDIALGKPYVDIANRLGISAKSVENRTRYLRVRLGALNNTHMIYMLFGEIK